MKDSGEGKKRDRKKWDREHYTKIVYDERNEIVAAFREKCKREGVAQSSILRKAVYDFLGKEGGKEK